MNRYHPLSKLLHWLMAVLILAAFGIGLAMADAPLSPKVLAQFSYHKWIGITVLGLVALRLLWRLLKGVPAMPDSMKPWEKLAAHLGHLGLYLLMIGVPLVGWLMSSAKGVPVVYFKLVRLPDLIAADKALGEQLAEVHETLAWLLIALVVLHVLAALKHHFVNRDTVLQRMLPFAKVEE